MPFRPALSVKPLGFVICVQTIERYVRWLKGCRSISTRHEKLAVNFALMVKLAFSRQYLRTIRPSYHRAVEVTL